MFKSIDFIYSCNNILYIFLQCNHTIAWENKRQRYTRYIIEIGYHIKAGKFAGHVHFTYLLAFTQGKGNATGMSAVFMYLQAYHVQL